MAISRWQAAADLLGHTVKNKDVGGQHWVVCSCGYKSSPGKSVKFAISAGIGHIQRVADALRAAGELEIPDTPGVVPRNVRGRR